MILEEEEEVDTLTEVEGAVIKVEEEEEVVTEDKEVAATPEVLFARC